VNILRSVAAGAAAGAVGTVALDLTSYADMVVRGRAASDVPSKLVRNLAASAGIEPLLADDDATRNRRAAAGALLGYVNGLGVGALFGAVRPWLRGVPAPIAALGAGAAAMALSDVPMAATGTSDPRTWGTAGWISDIVPHVMYGLALVWAFDAFGGCDSAP
jgi:hypothetical protein